MDKTERERIDAEIADLKDAWKMLALAVISMNNNLNFNLGEEATKLYRSATPKGHEEIQARTLGATIMSLYNRWNTPEGQAPPGVTNIK